MAAILDFCCKLATSKRKKDWKTFQVGIVIVAWDRDRTIATLALLNKHLETSTHIDANVVVVCNNPVLAADLEETKYNVIVGSNERMDFSGYDEGLSLLAHHAELDIILLANDRFIDHGTDHFKLLQPEVLDLIEVEGLTVGEICSALGDVYEVFGRQVATHIRTSFVIAPASVFRKIRSVSTIDESEFSQLVSREFPGPDWIPSACVNEELAVLLMEWLTGQTHPHTWHRSEPLTESSWPRMRVKLHTIFNQYTLASQFENEGMLLVGTTLCYLLSQLPESDQFRKDWLELLRSSPWTAANVEAEEFLAIRIALVTAWRTFQS